jgi:tetratricopeptide (TPR) repeat protein
MKNNILTALILSITIGISAQNVKKPYKMLEKGDYEKAKELFMKNLTENKEHVASNFGMAMILADDKSPYFNIVDSWQYIEIIDGRSNELNQDEIEILGEYFLETEVRKTSRPVKKKIDIAIEAVESRLIKYIREENDLEAVYAVLEKYPDYRHYDNVIHIRNQFEFRKYEKMNTKAGYEEFIAKFPEAAQVPKAERYRNKMAFEEAKAENSVLSYNKYIKDYPGSVHLQQAIKLRNTAAFAEAKSKHSLAAYEGFIALYPDALEIPEARKYQHELMYEKAKRIKSLQAYNEFIRMYPDGAYYIDVFNLKAEDLGHQYFQTLGFSSNDLNWVKALDNNEFIDEAQAFAITPQGEHVIAGTTRANDTSFTDAWIIKLDANGKMLWNKTIGQPF